MSVKRLTRVNELLKREIAAGLFRVMNEAGFDLSAVTVTHVITSSDLRTARVLVSIRDHQRERGRMLSLLRHHRSTIQDIVHKNVILKYTPHLSFELDPSLEEGDRVLSLIAQLEAAEDKPEDGPPPMDIEHENG